MDPETGEIFVMASAPSFDQNAFVDGMSHKQWESLISNPLRPMENKAIQGEYPPASTFKIVTAIAGLEEGVIDENTTMNCPGHYKYGNRIYRCWRYGGHGNVNIIKALAESCDVFFYQVGQNVGIDRLAFYAKACGLGSETGINLDDESAGLVPTAAWKKRRTGIAWQGGETLSVAIGQGYNLSTPLQMLVLTSALANGGTRYKPLILKSVRTVDGHIVIQSKKQVIGGLPAGKKTLEIVKEGLREVVSNPKGTAHIAYIEDVDISGKTGTAQVVGRRNEPNLSEKDMPDQFKPHAWFVAYAPSADPQIAVAVFVEHGGHGSTAAAPIARDIIRTYLEKDEYGRQLKAQNSKQ
jgi:penicillin-binding protein 2